MVVSISLSHIDYVIQIIKHFWNQTTPSPKTQGGTPPSHQLFPWARDSLTASWQQLRFNPIIYRLSSRPLTRILSISCLEGEKMVCNFCDLASIQHQIDDIKQATDETIVELEQKNDQPRNSNTSILKRITNFEASWGLEKEVKKIKAIFQNAAEWSTLVRQNQFPFRILTLTFSLTQILLTT